MINSIGLKGYYGFGNFGDDILMVAALNLLKSVLPNSKISIVSEGPSTSYIENLIGESLEVVRLGDRRQLDLMFLGGGGVFFDFNEGSFYYRGMNTIIQALGPSSYKKIRDAFRPPKPNYKIGMGMGLGAGLYTQSSNKFHNSMYEISKMKLLLMRDEKSVQQIEKIVTEAGVQLSTDLAFGKKYWMPQVNLERPTEIQDKPKIGFVLRKWKWDKKNEIISSVLELKDKYDIQVILFQKAGDEDFAKAFVENEIPVFVWDPHHMKIKDCVDSLSLCDVIVSSRAHGCIVAGLLGIPFVALAIEPKLVAIQKMFPNGSILQEETSKEKLIESINKLCGDINKYRSGCLKDSDQQSKILELGIKQIKSLLLEENGRSL